MYTKISKLFCAATQDLAMVVCIASLITNAFAAAPPPLPEVGPEPAYALGFDVMMQDSFESPAPECEALPPRDCVGDEQFCGEIVFFEPEQGTGYDNYPINGETKGNQYRSFSRRDLRMLIKYAAARVQCQADGWPTGHGSPIGLGDMSEADGSIPGTSIGQPGHVPPNHENGLDIDTAYYQIDTVDNRLRPICNTLTGGNNQFHCVDPPHLLDAERTSLFLGSVAGHPRLRQIIVDGEAGLLIDAAADNLCSLGLLDGDECTRLGDVLVYELEDSGQGQFFFYYHHIHISLLPIE